VTIARPIPLVVIPDSIPDELKACAQWVSWSYEPKPDNPTEWTKPPYVSKAGSRQKASSTDLTTWSSFAQALAAVPRFEGVGFVLSDTDEYGTLDVDHCRDADLGTIEPWAREIVDAFPSYWEVSPSGTGTALHFPRPTARRRAEEAQHRGVRPRPVRDRDRPPFARHPHDGGNSAGGA
jgi:hypothetical protein